MVTEQGHVYGLDEVHAVNHPQIKPAGCALPISRRIRRLVLAEVIGIVAAPLVNSVEHRASGKRIGESILQRNRAIGRRAVEQIQSDGNTLNGDRYVKATAAAYRKV